MGMMKMKPYWLLVLLVCSLVSGCSCGGGNDPERPAPDAPQVSRSESFPDVDPPFMAFKEIRYEQSTYMPSVGDVVESRICLVPVDDLMTVEHPWIRMMRKQDPNFSIVGLLYQVRFTIQNSGADRSRFEGREFLSATSQIRKNATYAVGSYEDTSTGFYVIVSNLVLDQQSDTITIKMRFANPGHYSTSASVFFNAQYYNGLSPISMNGRGGGKRGRFIVGERQ